MTFQFTSAAKGKKFIHDHPEVAKQYGITAESLRRFIQKKKKKEKK